MSKRKQLRKTYDEFMHKYGRAPTGVEVAKLMNTTEEYAYQILRLEGLAYSSLKKAVPTEAEIRTIYSQMVAELGEPPRIDQIAQRIGMKEFTVRQRLKAYGLPHTHMSNREAGRLGGQKSRIRRVKNAVDQSKIHNASKVEKHEDKDPFIQEINAERDLRLRVYEITHSGDVSKRPRKLRSPGEGYTPAQRIMVVCEVCRRRVWIAPRMHPFWLRDCEGNVHWVCSGICTGNVG